MEPADFVNESPPTAKIGALSNYLKEESARTPIDVYREGVAKILSYGTTERLSESDFLGRLLVLGLVSATEGYVRAILASSIELCPIAQAKASTQSINLGGLLWHGKTGFSRSAFEHASFTSAAELEKAVKNFIGFQMNDAVFEDPLRQYDIVCQLRHGIVHGDGFLPGRNAVLLDIPKYDKPVRIRIGYNELQEIASVVNTLVFTFNREIFKEFCKRWAIDWRKRSNWDPENEGKKFKEIWDIFHSQDEKSHRQDKRKIIPSLCMKKVKNIYGV